MLESRVPNRAWESHETSFSAMTVSGVCPRANCTTFFYNSVLLPLSTRHAPRSNPESIPDRTGTRRAIEVVTLGYGSRSGR
jgi:hypothetical protein